MLPAPDSTIQALRPLLRQFVRGDYGLAVGGAHAKHAADALSDLDIYLFATEVLPGAERAALAQQFSPSIHSLTRWGDDTPFVQSGTDFNFEALRVECWLRNVSHINAILAECQAGIVKQEPVTWTVMGFYNHCTLNDLHKMQLIDDPAGILAGWQTAVSVYPPLLRNAIIARHLRAAKFWYRNFHYDTAVQRGDVLYVTGIVQQVLHNLIQVLFALNRTYFGGDKKIPAQLAPLTLKPVDFEQRMTALLRPDTLEQQQAALFALVDEVAALVSADDDRPA
jgi:hypothetical protein